MEREQNFTGQTALLSHFQKWVETYPSEFVDDHTASTDNPLKPATGKPSRQGFELLVWFFCFWENPVAT